MCRAPQRLADSQTGSHQPLPNGWGCIEAECCHPLFPQAKDSAGAKYEQVWVYGFMGKGRRHPASWSANTRPCCRLCAGTPRPASTVRQLSSPSSVNREFVRIPTHRRPRRVHAVTPQAPRLERPVHPQVRHQRMECGPVCRGAASCANDTCECQLWHRAAALCSVR